MTTKRLRSLSAFIALLTTALASAQQQLPAPLAGPPANDVPVAVQILRWHMLDNDVSSLAFRSMDTLFTTRTVAHGGPVWTLPHDDHPLNVSYSWQGKSYTAQQFFDRTYTVCCPPCRIRRLSSGDLAGIAVLARHNKAEA